MIRCLAAAICCALLGASATAESLTMTLPEARAVARDAYIEGDPYLALALAQRLLEADAQDAEALLLVAAARNALGQPHLAFEAGRKAWRASPDVPLLRYEIARHTALAAYQSNQLTRAQFWLRRASDVTTDENQRLKTAADFAKVRAQNPLRFNLSLNVTPSSNINGGANGSSLLIDRDYYVGNILRDGRALAGVRARGTVQLAYRIAQTAQSQTTLGLRLSSSAHRFSAAAQHAVPNASASDLNETSIEASISHDFLTAQSGTPVNVALYLGQNWAGGAIVGPNLRIEASAPLIDSADFALRLAGAAERQWQEGGSADALYLALDAQHEQPNGASFGWGISAADTHGDGRNQNHWSLGANLSYAPAQPLGKFTMNGRLGVGYRNFAAPYALGGGLAVTDGRQDQTIDLAMEFGMPELAWMGFTPKITLSQTETRSNISRYDTSDTGIAFGFETRF